MKPGSVLKILNPILFFAVAIHFAGILLQKFAYATWQSTMHVWIGYTIGLLIIIHIFFNWSWVKNNFLKKK